MDRAMEGRHGGANTLVMSGGGMRGGGGGGGGREREVHIRDVHPMANEYRGGGGEMVTDVGWCSGSCTSGRPSADRHTRHYSEIRPS